MAGKGDLRTQRSGTVINRISKKQETEMDKAVLFREVIGADVKNGDK